MEFRPCIDIHNGKVKQIVGGSLRDTKQEAVENFVSEQDAAFYANFYKKDGIRNGHIILLNPPLSPYYEATKQQAFLALSAYPDGMQIGGGITALNAKSFLEAGASHVIVTSYVFCDGAVNYENLKNLTRAVGKQRIVLDLSCRKKADDYYIVTDRWQKFTTEKVTVDLLDMLMEYADEFLIHAVDVEGKSLGIEKKLVSRLAEWGKIPITYAGGIGNFDHLKELKVLGQNKLHVTIGSALDIFGGNMEYEKVLQYVMGCANLDIEMHSK
ncbi:phosphoribosylformimino-5-aminoimidazole carboxamide ribotide isomerase [Lachnospiraceae bacterium ZAX-1]